MKALLIGEYSNVYRTLANGLNGTSNMVLVASNGDSWKNYSRDIDLKFSSSKKLLQYLIFNWNKFSNYDVVQIINPLFLFSGSKKSEELNKYFFYLVKKTNKKVYLSALGDDYFWVKYCMNNGFDYCALTAYEHPYPENQFEIALRYLQPHLEKLNRYICNNCDGIIASLYDYYMPYYNSEYKNKLSFVPLPINTSEHTPSDEKRNPNSKINFFIGIQNSRDKWKGTDILLTELNRLLNKYPNDIELSVARSVPFNEYTRLFYASDFFVDQLYSYSYGMNGLIAMAKGKVLIGGGERVLYDLIGEDHNFPIINIRPNIIDIRRKFEYVLDNRSKISEWKANTRLFVEKHHNYKSIAVKYIDIWKKQ